VPIQTAIGNYIIGAVGIPAYMQGLLLYAIPNVLVSGIVQEAAKLIPILGYWYFKKRTLTPKDVLSIGALSGAGFGIFEGQWVLNMIFAAGFEFSWFSIYGFAAFTGFIERLFTTGFHTASGALMGWGVAKGKWWLYYIIATLWHFATNYMVILYQLNITDAVQIEISVAVFAVALFAIVFFLRWRKTPQPEIAATQPLEIVPPPETAQQPEVKPEEPPEAEPPQPSNTEPSDGGKQS
jgi:RsiW-degrading membrane proteinase PrsW (M82 family)